jgi:hypothetical protein
MPDFSFEAAAGCDLVCGIDEVGRGPWAGPVVANDAEDNEQPDRCRLVVQPHAHGATIGRTLSSSPSQRFDQASQSVFTFRQTRLTVSFEIAPLNSRERATARQVFVPARQVPAISASPGGPSGGIGQHLALPPVDPVQSELFE